MKIPPKPLVSVVVPIYNVQSYIGECLDSLFRQTYSNIEYIFVNDASPDNSMIVLNNKIEEFSIHDKVRIINNPVNKGVAITKMLGVKMASGDYIIIPDSDDILSETAVEHLLNRALSCQADIVESNIVLFGSQEGMLKSERRNSVEEYLYYLLAFVAPATLCGKIYKRELFRGVEELFFEGRNYIDDYYTSCVVYGRATFVANIDEATYYYRTNNMSSYSHITTWNKIDDLVFAIRKLEQIYCKDGRKLFCDAINEAKYRIKSNYYPAYGPEDREKISRLFPEVDDYVRSKSIRERSLWYLIKHNYFLLYRVERKILNIVGEF